MMSGAGRAIQMNGILDSINSSEDVKKLNIKQLEMLAEEVREFLIQNVSTQGGHLSSNLGTVELTLALHKVFDVSKDRIVWDVGHQAYTHKILTGRKEDFSTLRQKDGLSGFPKTAESEADAFNTGHSSTSVSAALGFATAFKMKNEDTFAIAVIGDGALTGGMAYEALNHAGASGLPLIVILNDNGMSISENVGGICQHLEKMSSSAKYIGIKEKVNRFLKNIPVFGEVFRKAVRKSKRFIKKLLLQKKLFENMGLEYVGMVDGHDLKDLIAVIGYAKKSGKPTIVHVRTQKGKGYVPAEENPALFHGISKFDPDTGEPIENNKNTYSDIFGESVVKIAEKNKNVLCITAAMPLGTGLSEFAEKYPKQFFDVGIAEQHAVTFAASLAMSGYVPIFAVYSTFLQRGYDQIYHDVAIQNLHVVFAIDRAGAVGSDGETHQGIYDLSYLSHIPNMTIMAPADDEELRKMLEFAVDECKGPVAVRYPKGTAEVGICGEKIEYGKGVCLKEGKDVLIVALGSMVKEAIKTAEILEKQGVSVGIMSARFLKPFDEGLFAEMSKGRRVIATIEDNVCIGGLSTAVQSISQNKVLAFAFPDKPLQQASVSEQKGIAGLDAENIAKTIMDKLGD